MSKNTFRTSDGAKWPSVACRYQRQVWISEILKDEGIDTMPDFLTIALDLLRQVTTDQGQPDEARVRAFRAMLILERIE